MAYMGESSGSHDVPDPSRAAGIDMSASSLIMCMCCMSCSCCSSAAGDWAAIRLAVRTKNAIVAIATAENPRVYIDPCSPRKTKPNELRAEAGTRSEAARREGLRRGLVTPMAAATSHHEFERERRHRLPRREPPQARRPRRYSGLVVRSLRLRLYRDRTRCSAATNAA